ncbi:MAG: site-2 protease family protein [Chloroflexi bacterium]|nr:site-2 protease family protein [Chloroflexota bacterium]
MLLNILTGPDPLLSLLSLLIALVLGITVHEFAHAAAATWLGDSLPRRQGRLTLAPQAHLDVVGSLMFLAAGFGWGRPVSYDPYALRAGPRTGPALVAFAGPVANFIIALVFALVVRGLMFTIDASTPAWFIAVINLCLSIGHYNLILGFFNLIPVYPLDGFTVLLGVLPFDWAEMLERTRQYGILLMLLLLISGATSMWLGAPVNTLWGVLSGIR